MTSVSMIKDILKTSGWTQEQLAARLGVSFATVNSWLNGRTKPQKSLVPSIQRLYLAQDVTRDMVPTYITIVFVDDRLQVGDIVFLEKDKENSYDDEAIRVCLAESVGGEFDIMEREMYVANSVNSVFRGTKSAGRIYDKFDKSARAQVVFVLRNTAIARIVDWDNKL